MSFIWQIPQVSKSLGVEIAADVTGDVVAAPLTTVDWLGWTNHRNKSIIYRILGIVEAAPMARSERGR